MDSSPIWFGQQKGEGFEYHLLAIALALVVMIKGGGALSVDRALSKEANTRRVTEDLVANRIVDEIRQTRPFDSRRQEAALNILRIADMLKRGLDLLLKRHGITSAQYNVLRILRGAGEQGLHCGGIAERMITAEPDITRLLMRMERLGLLVRRRDAADRRMVTASATARGLQLLDEVELPLRKLQQHQFALLTDDEIEALIGSLEKVRESIAQTGKAAAD